MTTDLVEIRSLAAFLAIPEPGYTAKKSARFKTLCDSCNGEELGGHYDPALKAFTERAAVWLRSASELGLVLPSAMTISCKPQLVARAVIGHLLAARGKGGASLAAPFPAALRAYFLDKTLAQPENTTVFVWPYPVEKHVIMTGFGWRRLSWPRAIVGDALKFFPLAYWVAFVLPSDITTTLATLPLASTQFDDEVELRIPLDPIPPPTWPEDPGQDGLLFLRDHPAVVTTPRKPA